VAPALVKATKDAPEGVRGNLFRDREGECN